MKLNPKVSSQNFSKTIWPILARNVSKTLKLTDYEQEKLVNHRIAKLLAYIPFAAGCIDPDRTAEAHLLIYYHSNIGGRQTFDAKPVDDFPTNHRLWLMDTYRGGDQAILNRGKVLIHLHMLEGYKRDSELDQLDGIHNPVANDTWKYPDERKSLLSILEKQEMPEMDAIFSPADAQASGTYWDFTKSEEAVT